ncbi:HNH endonuclease [Prescottella equi]|uniref:HNH endonuclease n=1 Tax=Rhodococcus hoagii TaxID=43767 RepID=UPI000A1188C0|nr:HNH endonuclease [Prescottella equi]
MQLKRLTRPGVLQAIAECDRLGRDAFLAENKFAKAREYFLIHDRRSYDSKAIAGVAYRFDTGERVTAKDFTGGTKVADALASLGFQVTGDADWTWPELVLACDILHERGWDATVRAADPVVQELSWFLRSLDPDSALDDGYRSANSVQLKLENLRGADPDYRGKPTRYSKLDAIVVAAYLENPEAIHEAALQIRADAALGVMGQADAEVYPAVDELEGLEAQEIASALEGAVRRRWATQRERDPKLRKDKIAESQRLRGEVSCEVCGFDFSRAYPGRGDGYIEVHHRVPLHVSGEIENSLDDLVLLCANCHRMIHRASTWLTPEELGQILAEGREDEADQT